VRRPLRATQCRSERVSRVRSNQGCVGGHISFQTASIQLTHMENVTLFNKEEIKGLYQVSKTLTLFFFIYLPLRRLKVAILKLPLPLATSANCYLQLTHMEDVTLFNKEEIKGLYQVSKTLTLFFFIYHIVASSNALY
jgi:hypothetical protein